MSSQQPTQRKRIVPIPVSREESTASALQPSSSSQASAPQQPNIEYHKGPSRIPGRRLQANISDNYLVDYKELLKQNGFDIKQIKAHNSATAAAKAGKAPDSLPGLTRAGASPGAGGKAMLGNVVDRLERIYAMAGAHDDDDDEGLEGDSDEEEAEESGSDASESSSESEGSDDEAAVPSGQEQMESRPDGAAGTGGGGTGGATDGAGTGAASDGGGGAGSKKPKQRRRAFESYEVDFIDDDEEIRYEKGRRAKAKYTGFFINQGPVELERDPEAEEEQRQQGSKRAPRLRPPAGAQAAKASKHQAAGAAAGAAAAGMVTAVCVGAGDATAVGTDGMSSPQRAGGGKRRADGNQAQLACKKRKQPQADASALGPKSPGPALAVVSVAQALAAAQQQHRTGTNVPVYAAQAAAQDLATLAASMGRSAGAIAAAAGATAAMKSATTAAPALAPSERQSGGSVQRPGGEPSAQPPAASSSAPIGPQAVAPARGALVPTIGAGRRFSSNGASLELLINDCRKKLTAAAVPPDDWASLFKLVDATLTQIALYLHRNYEDDPSGYETGLAMVAAALMEVPRPWMAARGSGIPVVLLRDFLQRRVTKSRNELAKMVATVTKLAVDVAAADAAAPVTANGCAHSSDDEFVEPSSVSAAASLLEALEAKLRSYLNLHRKLHNTDDDGAALQSLAAQAGVSVDVLQRALLTTQSRPQGQRKRHGTKASASTADEAIRQQAAAIAAEIHRSQLDEQASQRSAHILAAAPAAPMAPLVATAAANTAFAVGAAHSGPAVAAGVVAAVGPAPSALAAASDPAAVVDPPGVQAAVCTSVPPSDVPQFPKPVEDHRQRLHSRAMLSSFPTAAEELLTKAFEAAAGSEWATLAIKVLCCSPDSLSVGDIAKRAHELRYIIWPPNKPMADMHRQLRQSMNRRSIAQHVLHVGNNKYLLQAMRPDAKPVPRPPAARSAGGGWGGIVGRNSASSSPAAAGPAAPLTLAGGVDTFSAAAGPPVPFLLSALAIDSSGFEVTAEEEQSQSQPLQQSQSQPLMLPMATQVGQDACGDAVGPAAVEEEQMLTLHEDAQQCREAVVAAVGAGADRERVVEALSKLRSRNIRIVFKVLCHAGPAGMRVVDIVKFARDHRFVYWPDADRTSSVHGAIRSSKDLVVHVGTHQYALALFPGVVHVPKPDARRVRTGGVVGPGAGEGPGGEGGDS